jgi:hypothetical protein
MAAELTYDEIADRLVEWAVSAPRLRALWLEGGTLEELRRPYRKLEVHLAADEPEFPLVIAELEATLTRLTAARVERAGETQRFARELELRSGRLPFTLIAEQSHLLAKRPRAEVVPLVDKTGHLPHVLDYSLRRR